MPNSRTDKKIHRAVFKPPVKNKKQDDDFESLAKTPCTPAASTDESESNKENAEGSINNSNQRNIEEIESKVQPRKSTRLKTPVLPKKSNTSDTNNLKRRSHDVSKPTDNKKRVKGFKTPQQSRKSAKTKTPLSENTQANFDFDSLETTPLPTEEKSGSNACKTPATKTDEDFDSLGTTPATDKIVPEKVGVDSLQVDEIVEGSTETGRRKRQRKQTKFFGEVKDSGKADIIIGKTKCGEQIPESSSSESDASDSESSDDEVREVRVVNRGHSGFQSSQMMSQNSRRSIDVVAKNDRFLEIHEVAYHPSLARARGWETDGVRAWVKPHPLPLIVNAKFSDNEIQSARNFSPGPPVCPWLVRSMCHGRYPMDEMVVRIAMQMRRSFFKHFLKKRRAVERSMAERTSLIVATRMNMVDQSDPLVLRYLFWRIYAFTKNMKFLTVQNFIDCRDLLSEICLMQHWHPPSKPLVECFLNMIAKQVLKHMDHHRFTPVFQEIFKQCGIPYTGKHVIPRGKKIKVFKPGSFPPFLTPREFERKWGVAPVIRTDEELTETFDSVGNVTGHFTVPNLRELLMPVTQEVEEEIVKEEEPERRKARKMKERFSKGRGLLKLYKIKKRKVLRDTTDRKYALKDLEASMSTVSLKEQGREKVKPQIETKVEGEKELSDQPSLGGDELKEDDKMDCKEEIEPNVEL